MKPLKPVEEKFWQEYLSRRGEPLHVEARVEASFAGNAAITDGLLRLYLVGKKSAGSSVVEDFVAAGDPLPAVGNYWILLASDGRPGAILRTVRVAFHKFLEVPVEIAVAEGEGDLSLEYWRRVHAELYTPHLRDWGLERIEDATIITEFFEIVHR